MANLRQQVGNLVRHHRKRVKLTQAELAERTDLSVELINRIERGSAAPSFETLDKLSKALRTPVRDFFGVGAYSVGGIRADPLQSLLDRVSGLSQEDLKWLDGVVGQVLKRKSR
jgi:transcriptional regulator with XRE-family HTH domain